MFLLFSEVNEVVRHTKKIHTQFDRFDFFSTNKTTAEQPIKAFLLPTLTEIMEFETDKKNLK